MTRMNKQQVDEVAGEKRTRILRHTRLNAGLHQNPRRQFSTTDVSVSIIAEVSSASKTKDQQA